EEEDEDLAVDVRERPVEGERPRQHKRGRPRQGQDGAAQAHPGHAPERDGEERRDPYGHREDGAGGAGGCRHGGGYRRELSTGPSRPRGGRGAVAAAPGVARPRALTPRG